VTKVSKEMHDKLVSIDNKYYKMRISYLNDAYIKKREIQTIAYVKQKPKPNGTILPLARTQSSKI
jgi:hypothetical protein